MRRTAFTCARLFSLVSAAGFSAITSAATAAVSQQRLFEAYPAADARPGAAASLQLTSPFAESYRGLLTPALRRPANFGGHYRLETWEARNGCFRGAAVDLATGAVRFLPLDLCGRGRPFAARNVAFRRGSTLVGIVDPTAAKGPVTRYFALNGADFTEVTKSLAQAVAAPAPAPSKPETQPKSEPEPAQTAVAPPVAPAPDAMAPPKGVDPVYPETARAPAPPARQQAADIESISPPKGADPVYPDPPPSADGKAHQPDFSAAQQDAADIEATSPPKGADPVYPDPPADPDDRTGSLEAPKRKMAALAPAEPAKPPAAETGSVQSLAFSACGSTWGYFIDASNKADVSLVLEGLGKGPTLVLHIKDGATASELVGVKDRGPWNLDLTVPAFGQEAMSRIIYSGRLIFVSLSFVQGGGGNKLILKTFGFNDTGKPCPSAAKATAENPGAP